MSGTAGNALLAFAVQSLLTRALGVADYGRLAALVATATLFVPMVSQAVGWFWFDLYAREGAGARRWGAAAVRLTLLQSVVAIGLLACYVLLHPPAGLPALASVVAAAFLMLGPAVAEARATRLQLEERYHALGLWQMAVQGGRMAVVLALLAAGAVALPAVLMGYAAVGALVLALSLPSVRRLAQGRALPAGAVGAPHAAGPSEPVGLGACFRASLPFSLATSFFLVYSQAVVPLVEALLGPGEAAYYNVAYLLFTAAAMFPSVYYMKFMASKIFRWWTHDRPMFVAAFHLGVAVHLVVGLVGALLLWSLAPWLVPLLFGAKYVAAVAATRILALGIPVRFVQHGYGSVLFSHEHIRRKITYMGVAALASLLLVMLLAPRFGAAGAAAAAVGSEAVLLMLYAQGAARHVQGIELRATFSPPALRAAWRLALSHRGTAG
jgi:O-antigen/teichoic acid export membrane protein